MVKFQENFIGCVNSQAQYAAIEALEGPQAALHAMVRTYAKRRKLIVEGINDIPGLSCVLAKRRLLLFRQRPRQVAYELRGVHHGASSKETGVVAVRARDSAAAGEGYIRLSYATSTGTSRMGLPASGGSSAAFRDVCDRSRRVRHAVPGCARIDRQGETHRHRSGGGPGEGCCGGRGALPRGDTDGGGDLWTIPPRRPGRLRCSPFA